MRRRTGLTNQGEMEVDEVRKEEIKETTIRKVAEVNGEIEASLEVEDETDSKEGQENPEKKTVWTFQHNTSWNGPTSDGKRDSRPATKVNTRNRKPNIEHQTGKEKHQIHETPDNSRTRQSTRTKDATGVYQTYQNEKRGEPQEGGRTS